MKALIIIMVNVSMAYTNNLKKNPTTDPHNKQTEFAALRVSCQRSIRPSAVWWDNPYTEMHPHINEESLKSAAQITFLVIYFLINLHLLRVKILNRRCVYVHLFIVCGFLNRWWCGDAVYKRYLF